jgi:hypothetical protein
MCVYCEGLFTSDTVVCPNCDEYKGMMPVSQAVEYLDLDPADYE